MDPAYVQNLHQLLQQSTAPDTALIKQATATLHKDYYRAPEVIPALFQIVVSTPDQTIRQFAAVELRKRIASGLETDNGSLWTKVPPPMREEIKSKSLEIVLTEAIPLIRHAIARIIAAIAEVELSEHAWPALLPWLNQSTTDANVASRESGIYVLYSSLETVINSEPTIIGQFITHFTNLLNDPESLEVRSTAVRSMGILSQYIEIDNKPEIAAFQQAVPNMVQVIQAAIANNKTEVFRHGIDVFETLLILEVPLLSKHIAPLVEFFTTVGQNNAIDEEVRIMALNALTWTIKYKKSKVQSLNLAKPILDALLVIGAEPEPEDVEEEAPSRIAFRAIDALATALPPTQVFNPLMSLVEQYIQSPDENLRKSALTSFGVAVEGCSEYMRPHINKLWPLIDRGLQDPAPIVRKAACIAFGCLCEWLEEECAERHTILMPALMNLMDDPTSQAPACTALDAFLEILGTDIAQYLPLIMTRLSGLLETGSLQVKALVTGAIGSAAHASGQNFQPYFEQTLQRVQPFFALQAEGEEQELRGIAMDALGTIAEAVGKEQFAPYFGQSVHVAAEAMAQQSSARLRECAFLMFGTLARLFESEFAPFLDPVVKGLNQSCAQAEHGDISADLAALSGGSSGDGDVDIDEDGADGLETLQVNSAIAVEKEIAADTLGTIFAAVGPAFLPYLEESTNQLITLLDHYYEGIRKSATSSLLEFIQTFYSLSNPPLWEPGLPLRVPLDPKVKELIGAVIPSIMAMWETEDDKTVASQVCQGLAETITKVGPGLLEGHLEDMCTLAKQILEKKALCQQDPDQDDDEEDDDEEQAEYDSVLISTASDLVSSIATVLGADFAQAFGTFMPLLLKYYSKNRAVSDRSSSIGSLGEIITGMKGGITQYTQPLYEHIYKAFSDPEPEVRSNAAFAAGVLVENSDMDLSGQYLSLLAGLRPFFEVAPGSPAAQFNARDNAAGAVARLIIKNPAAVPLDQVLPVLVDSLPLRNDFLENRAVFSAILLLFQSNPPVITPYTDRLLPVFAHVLDPAQPDQVPDEIRAQLIALIQALNTQVPDKIQATGLSAFL